MKINGKQHYLWRAVEDRDRQSAELCSCPPGTDS
ncbi:MAG: hypothetical protein R3E64_03565 [Halioglobus sp.]